MVMHTYCPSTWKEHQEFKVIFIYIISSRPARGKNLVLPEYLMLQDIENSQCFSELINILIL